MWNGKLVYYRQNGHSKEDCKLLVKSAEENKNDAKKICEDIEYSMIKVSVVREYLKLEVYLNKLVQKLKIKFRI